MCCHNNYVVKNAESDMNMIKKDIARSKIARKRNATDYNAEEEDNNSKFKINKEVLDKHIKDNSFKINASHAITETNYDKLDRINEEMKINQHIMTLTVLNSSSTLQKGSTVSINCQGLVTPSSDALRNGKDGLVYFGFSPEEVKTELKQLDFVLNIPMTNEENSSNIGKHFVIEFKLDAMNYFIKDLGVGFGTFVRLDSTLVLKDNHLINIGETFLVANIVEKNADGSQISNQQGTSILSTRNMQLKLKIFGINNNGETFYFPPVGRNIGIGRCVTADIQLNDKLLSKIHCTINYSENDGWTLSDGQEHKPSTNGTWLYLNEDFEMYDKMIFKSNQTIFQCSYSP